MAKVEMYTTMWCGYCARARNLLQRKGVDFEDIDVEADTAKRTEMVQRAGGRTTVPQIFIYGVQVCGSDELAALERAGKLDPLLEANGVSGGQHA
jgi:glutaredoxin 3